MATAWWLILLPGLSTAEAVGNVTGRGITVDQIFAGVMRFLAMDIVVLGILILVPAISTSLCPTPTVSTRITSKPRFLPASIRKAGPPWRLAPK